MEWTLFALLQMFIITVGVSLACWLRMRGAQQQNAQLRLHIESINDNPPADTPTAETRLNELIEQLAEDDASTPVVRLVLQHALQPVSEFEAALGEAVQAAGLVAPVESGEHETRIAELEAALEAAKSAAETGAEGEDPGRTEELKTLLQQFTRDSREMMACIQSLEAENAQLREQLGDDAPAPAGAADPAEDAA